MATTARPLQQRQGNVKAVGRQVLRKTQPKVSPKQGSNNHPRQEQQKQQQQQEKKPSPILKKVSSFDAVLDVPQSPSTASVDDDDDDDEEESSSNGGVGSVDYQSPLRQDGLIMDPPTPLFFSFTYGLYSENKGESTNKSDKLSSRNATTTTTTTNLAVHAARVHQQDEDASSNCSSCTTLDDPSPLPRRDSVPQKKRVTFAVPEAVPFTIKKVPSAPSLSSLPPGNGVSPRRFSSTNSTGGRGSNLGVSKTLQPSYSFPRRQGPPKLAKVAPEGLFAAEDEPGGGKKRCAWITSQSDPAYVEYHDTEWGVPVHDDRKLFELLVFAGAQAELSWSALLSKREHYRNAFCGFDPEAVSKFDENTIASLAADPEILQHEGRLRHIVDNAKCIMEVVQEFGSFDKFVWSFLGGYRPIVNKYRTPQQVPIKSAKSDFMSRDFMKRGFRFVGPTVMHSFMQAAGLTNDHLLHCFRHSACCSVEETSVSASGCSSSASGGNSSSSSSSS